MKFKKITFLLLVAGFLIPTIACENVKNSDNSEVSKVNSEADKQLIVSGPGWVYAPKAGEITTSEPFTAKFSTGESADVIWEMASSAKGASIDQNGVVTITDEYIYGDINGSDLTLKATLDSTVATVTLHVRERQRVGSFELIFPVMAYVGERVDIKFENASDQYGEPIEINVSDVSWDLSLAGMKVKGNQVWTDVALTDPEVFAGVRAKIDGVTAEGRFIIAKRIKGGQYEVTAEIKKALAEAKILYASDIDFSEAREVDKSKYVLTVSDFGDSENLSLDVSGLICVSEKPIYQVTVKWEDGSADTYDTTATAGSVKIALNKTLADGAKTKASVLEISPVLKFALGKAENKDNSEYAHVEISDAYTNEVLYGFYGISEAITGGIAFKSDDSAFVAAVPDGFYNIRITKPMSGTGRSTVCVNGASLGTNVGNPGKGDRSGSVPYSYLMEDVNVIGGSLRISLSEKDLTLAEVEIRKSPEILPRRVHVYIGGDSTVSNYYPIETEEPAYGRFQTGWGQVIGQYFTSENVITSTAGGGTFAKSWYEMAFPGVIQNGQPGDYFLIHAGINDRTYSNKEEMVTYLTKMIDECEAKGITVILCTAMQTPKFWKDAQGKEVDEFGTPEGGGLAAFMDSIRKLAKDKNVFLADVGAMTGEWYSKLGRSYVASHYHLYNSASKTEEDTLHLSYHGALKIAEMICTDLQKQKDAGAKDHLGHTLDGLSFNPLHTYTVEHKDAAGNTVVEEVTAVQAIYERYGIENK